MAGSIPNTTPVTALAKSAEMIARIIGENPAAAAATRTGPIATDIDCDECGKPMMIRKGRRGPFLGCSGYPKCKNTGEVPAKLMEEMGLNTGNGNGKADQPTEPAARIEPLDLDHEDAA